MLRSKCKSRMSNLTEVVDSLETRINTLLELYKALQERLDILEGTIVSLDAENAELKEKVAEKQQEYNTLKTANALLGSNDYKRETKLKINALIREIDACVVALSD